MNSLFVWFINFFPAFSKGFLTRYVEICVSESLLSDPTKSIHDSNEIV